MKEKVKLPSKTERFSSHGKVFELNEKQPEIWQSIITGECLISLHEEIYHKDHFKVLVTNQSTIILNENIYKISKLTTASSKFIYWWNEKDDIIFGVGFSHSRICKDFCNEFKKLQMELEDMPFDNRFRSTMRQRKTSVDTNKPMNEHFQRTYSMNFRKKSNVKKSNEKKVLAPANGWSETDEGGSTADDTLILSEATPRQPKPPIGSVRSVKNTKKNSISSGQQLIRNSQGRKSSRRIRKSLTFEHNGENEKASLEVKQFTDIIQETSRTVGLVGTETQSTMLGKSSSSNCLGNSFVFKRTPIEDLLIETRKEKDRYIILYEESEKQREKSNKIVEELRKEISSLKEVLNHGSGTIAKWKEKFDQCNIKINNLQNEVDNQRREKKSLIIKLEDALIQNKKYEEQQLPSEIKMSKNELSLEEVRQSFSDSSFDDTLDGQLNDTTLVDNQYDEIDKSKDIEEKDKLNIVRLLSSVFTNKKESSNDHYIQPVPFREKRQPITSPQQQSRNFDDHFYENLPRKSELHDPIYRNSSDVMRSEQSSCCSHPTSGVDLDYNMSNTNSNSTEYDIYSQIPGDVSNGLLNNFNFSSENSSNKQNYDNIIEQLKNVQNNLNNILGPIGGESEA
ncbi:hypothetical protein SNEBB_004719 [Seison nebaliae]|nr:hypothetical protein SNEBB_004719 [Seison nebaliae]